jgi:hypothetical protein
MISNTQLDVLVRGGLAGLLLVSAVGVWLGARHRTPVQWSIHKSANGITPDRIVEITVVADIVRGWHVYSLIQAEGGPAPLRFALGDTEEASVIDCVGGPLSQVRQQATFDVPVRLYRGRAEFTVPVRLAEWIGNGTHRLHLRVTWQSGNGSINLPARTTELPFDVNVIPV